MPFTTPNRTLRNDCYPKGDFHQYSVKDLSQKSVSERPAKSVCLIRGAPPSPGEIMEVSRISCQTVSSLRPLRSVAWGGPSWLFWLLFTTRWPRWMCFIREHAHSQLGNNAENQSAASMTTTHLIGEMRWKEKCSDLPVGPSFHALTGHAASGGLRGS